jgi:hypothetical protein
MADQHNSGNPYGDLELTILKRSLQELYRTRAVIGTIPPAPPTPRGRFGGLLVGLVRRAMFWVWPQLDQFHAAAITFAENQVTWLEELRGLLGDIDRELEQLRQDLSRLENRSNEAAPPSQPEDQLWLQLVRCQARIETVQGVHRDEAQQAPDRLA